jgi:beta-glucosidase
VVGSKADDVGALCGGWTQTWQGSTGPITNGETVFEGLKRRFGSGNVRLSYTGEPVAGFAPDVTILVAGETPYAEGNGDSTTLTPDSRDLGCFDRWSHSPNAGRPLVTLVVSGRPLVMNDILNRSAAVAALWLPGSEAGSVAEVIAGAFKPAGKLPQPWPANAEQGKTVWPLGYGLNY